MTKFYFKQLNIVCLNIQGDWIYRLSNNLIFIAQNRQKIEKKSDFESKSHFNFIAFLNKNLVLLLWYDLNAVRSRNDQNLEFDS